MGGFREYMKQVLNEQAFLESDNNFDELEGSSEDVTLEELHDLIDYLDEVDYDIIADLILDYLDTHYEDEPEIEEFDNIEGDDTENEEFDGTNEAVSARFKNKKKGVRKFKISKAILRQGRIKRKSILRKTRVKRRIARKKVRVKLKKYQASRSKAIKSGQHQPKTHRGK